MTGLHPLGNSVSWGRLRLFPKAVGIRKPIFENREYLSSCMAVCTRNMKQELILWILLRHQDPELFTVKGLKLSFLLQERAPRI